MDSDQIQFLAVWGFDFDQYDDDVSLGVRAATKNFAEEHTDRTVEDVYPYESRSDDSVFYLRLRGSVSPGLSDAEAHDISQAVFDLLAMNYDMNVTEVGFVADRDAVMADATAL